MKFGTMMKRTLSTLLVVCCCLATTQVAFAKDTTINAPGSVYEFTEKENYPYSSASATGTATTSNTRGTFSIAGDMKASGQKNGFQTYVVSSGNITFSYKFDSSILSAAETEWHLIDDKNKKVDDINLEKNIMSGAVIVQSSKDGSTWITDVQLCDVFDTADSLNEAIYTTKDIQLENGCYYRVIVVYEMKIKTGEKKNLIGTSDITEQKRFAEVYEFYAVSSETAGSTMSAASTPRKELASKPINTGKDNGYSGNNAIDKDDPHFGWELGTFVINGYTRETNYNGSPVYLKNVGDKVTLWFTLKQDINALNGNSDLTISEDTNGYDQTFGVNQTNFGHGALIISYTDFEGKTHDPIIYTDFLSAIARTGADTRVQLFEEGDYVVTLDYEIKNNPLQIGPVSVVPTYTNYKITFSFSIRNGNCMVYPFDTKTGNELSDNAITNNGFMLDMARSRYLNIDVSRTVLNVNSEGLLSEDVRFNRPAADNDSYTDNGIYTFTVKNLYTGATTTKTIYVGTDKYVLALSRNACTVAELNAKISEGYTIEDDGSLTAPIVPTEPEPETTAEPQTEESTTAEVSQTTAQVENTVVPADNTEESVMEEPSETDNSEEDKSGGSVSPVIFVVIGLLAAGGGAFALKKKKPVVKKEDNA